MIIKSLLLIASCLLVVNFIGLKAEAVPEIINIQGVLTDNQGKAHENWDGKAEFEIWSKVTGGIKMWETAAGGIDIKTDGTGFFSKELDLHDGIYSPGFSLGEIFKKTAFMQVKINGSPLEPRQQFVTVPYAAMSRNLRGGYVAASDENVAVDAISNTSYAVRGRGETGVIGFNRNYPADYTGTYGLLGGKPLTKPGVLVIPGIYKYGAFGQANANTKGYLGYYRQPQNQSVTEAGVFGITVSGSGVMGSGTTGVDGYGTSMGVVGRGIIGVHGKSESSGGTGVAGIATGTNGIALYGKSQNYFGLFVEAPKNYFTGNVGIGTTVPHHRLDLGAGIGKKLAVFQNSAGTDFYGLGISGDTLEFWAGDNNRMVVKKSTGNVGIGTTNPTAKLAIVSDGSHTAPQLLVHETGSGDFARIGLQDTYGRWVIAAKGDFFDPTQAWLNFHYDVNLFQVRGDGNIYMKNNVLIHSDRRLKNNVTPLSNVLDKISGLRGVSFEWNEKGVAPGQKGIGMIAQEMEACYPELVDSDIDGYKSIDYGKFTAVLLEAIKEQQKEIENLKKEIAELKR